MKSGAPFELDEIYGTWHVPWFKTPAGIILLVLSIIAAGLLLYLCVWYFIQKKRLSDVERARLQVRALNLRAKRGALASDDLAHAYDTLARAFMLYALRYDIAAGCTQRERSQALQAHMREPEMQQKLDAFVLNEQNVRYAHKESSVDRLIEDVELLDWLFNERNEQK